METHRLKKCLKLGILLLIVPSLFWKCQEKDDLDNIQLQSKNESYKIVSLDDLPKLKPIINNIKGFGHNGSVLLRGGETFMGIDHVLVDEIIQVTKEEASTYTLGIDTDFKNSKYIENLHIIEVENGYIAYIMRYEPIAGWEDDDFNRTPEGDLVFNPAKFNGDITKYSLEREIIWTTKPAENTQARTITTCIYSVVRYCTNDGYGGTNGDPHVCGPKCTGPFYSEVEYTCTYGFTGGGGNYDDHTGGGSSENENDDCVEIAGTLIQDSQPLSGISTGCATNIDTGISQPVNEEDDCNTSKEDLKKVFPNMSDTNAELLASIINDKGQDFGIDSDETLWHFLAQAGHETGGFNTLNVTESTYWTTATKLAAKYSRFTMDSTLAATDNNKYYAPDYLQNSSGVANIAMCCDYGNGDVASGDGYKYRGRGIFQLTWKDNYTAFKTWYNNKYNPDIDPVTSPDIIASNDTLAILSGLWYYKTRVVDVISGGIDSTTTVDKVTKPINKGLSGLSDRKQRFQKAKDSINCL